MRLFRKNTRAFRNLFFGLIGLFATLVAGCSGEEQAVPQSPTQTEGFAFLDVGATTPYTEALRERLKNSLGSDAISYRNIIDLEVNGEGFLEKHFPDLYQLNLRLNTPPGERVEHNTVKLMYRYARNKNLPFYYVELVFSNHTERPLFIHINASRDISDILRTLEDKFGKPMKIDLPQEETGQAMYWRDKKDVLLATIAPTRRDDNEYRIMIYFADNIDELVSLEEKDRREKEEGRRRAGEKAF